MIVRLSTLVFLQLLSISARRSTEEKERKSMFEDCDKTICLLLKNGALQSINSFKLAPGGTPPEGLWLDTRNDSAWFVTTGGGYPNLKWDYSINGINGYQVDCDENPKATEGSRLTNRGVSYWDVKSSHYYRCALTLVDATDSVTDVFRLYRRTSTIELIGQVQGVYRTTWTRPYSFCPKFFSDTSHEIGAIEAAPSTEDYYYYCSGAKKTLWLNNKPFTAERAWCGTRGYYDDSGTKLGSYEGQQLFCHYPREERFLENCDKTICLSKDNEKDIKLEMLEPSLSGTDEAYRKLGIWIDTRNDAEWFITTTSSSIVINGFKFFCNVRVPLNPSDEVRLKIVHRFSKNEEKYTSRCVLTAHDGNSVTDNLLLYKKNNIIKTVYGSAESKGTWTRTESLCPTAVTDETHQFGAVKAKLDADDYFYTCSGAKSKLWLNLKPLSTTQAWCGAEGYFDKNGVKIDSYNGQKLYCNYPEDERMFEDCDKTICFEINSSKLQRIESENDDDPTKEGIWIDTRDDTKWRVTIASLTDAAEFTDFAINGFNFRKCQSVRSNIASLKQEQPFERGGRRFSRCLIFLDNGDSLTDTFQLYQDSNEIKLGTITDRSRRYEGSWERRTSLCPLAVTDETHDFGAVEATRGPTDNSYKCQDPDHVLWVNTKQFGDENEIVCGMKSFYYTDHEKFESYNGQKLFCNYAADFRMFEECEKTICMEKRDEELKWTSFHNVNQSEEGIWIDYRNHSLWVVTLAHSSSEDLSFSINGHVIPCTKSSTENNLNIQPKSTWKRKNLSFARCTLEIRDISTGSSVTDHFQLYQKTKTLEIKLLGEKDIAQGVVPSEALLLFCPKTFANKVQEVQESKVSNIIRVENENYFRCANEQYVRLNQTSYNSDQVWCGQEGFRTKDNQFIGKYTEDEPYCMRVCEKNFILTTEVAGESPNVSDPIETIAECNRVYASISINNKLHKNLTCYENGGGWMIDNRKIESPVEPFKVECFGAYILINDSCTNNQVKWCDKPKLDNNGGLTCDANSFVVFNNKTETRLYLKDRDLYGTNDKLIKSATESDRAFCYPVCDLKNIEDQCVDEVDCIKVNYTINILTCGEHQELFLNDKREAFPIECTYKGWQRGDKDWIIDFHHAETDPARPITALCQHKCNKAYIRDSCQSEIACSTVIYQNRSMSCGHESEILVVTYNELTKESYSNLTCTNAGLITDDGKLFISTDKGFHISAHCVQVCDASSLSRLPEECSNVGSSNLECKRTYNLSERLTCEEVYFPGTDDVKSGTKLTISGSLLDKDPYEDLVCSKTGWRTVGGKDVLKFEADKPRPPLVAKCVESSCPVGLFAPCVAGDNCGKPILTKHSVTCPAKHSLTYQIKRHIEVFIDTWSSLRCVDEQWIEPKNGRVTVEGDKKDSQVMCILRKGCLPHSPIIHSCTNPAMNCEAKLREKFATDSYTNKERESRRFSCGRYFVMYADDGEKLTAAAEFKCLMNGTWVVKFNDNELYPPMMDDLILLCHDAPLPEPDPSRKPVDASAYASALPAALLSLFFALL